MALSLVAGEGISAEGSPAVGIVDVEIDVEIEDEGKGDGYGVSESGEAGSPLADSLG
jgi:hypothetical protein